MSVKSLEEKSFFCLSGCGAGRSTQSGIDINAFSRVLCLKFLTRTFAGYSANAFMSIQI